jgi:hypothetical protein
MAIFKAFKLALQANLGIGNLENFEKEMKSINETKKARHQKDEKRREEKRQFEYYNFPMANELKEKPAKSSYFDVNIYPGIDSKKEKETNYFPFIESNNKKKNNDYTKDFPLKFIFSDKEDDKKSTNWGTFEYKPKIVPPPHLNPKYVTSIDSFINKKQNEGVMGKPLDMSRLKPYINPIDLPPRPNINPDYMPSRSYIPDGHIAPGFERYLNLKRRF